MEQDTELKFEITELKILINDLTYKIERLEKKVRFMDAYIANTSKIGTDIMNRMSEEGI